MNPLYSALKSALRKQTGLDTFLSAKLTSQPQTKRNSLSCVGYPKGEKKSTTFEGDLPGDNEGKMLRELVIQKAGKIDGEIVLIEFNVDFLMSQTIVEVYYEAEGKKLKKAFTL